MLYDKDWEVCFIKNDVVVRLNYMVVCVNIYKRNY